MAWTVAPLTYIAYGGPTFVSQEEHCLLNGFGFSSVGFEGIHLVHVQGDLFCMRLMH